MGKRKNEMKFHTKYDQWFVHYFSSATPVTMMPLRLGERYNGPEIELVYKKIEQGS